jgi:cell division protein FtsI (penicillin-binding protein 3)
VLISAQIIRVQYVQGDAYIAKADSLHTKYATIHADRGSIYAENNDLLATSFPYYDIVMDPCAASKNDFKKNIDSLSICLSKLFGDKSASDYKQKITQARNQGKRYLSLKTKVTLPQKKQLEKFPLFRLGKNTGGLITVQTERRIYPYGSLANRTIGYVNQGIKVGLEGAFDSVLSGLPGHRLMQKVSGGTWVPVNDGNEIDPVQGMDLITTLDINMQDIAEAALKKSLVANNAAWGTAVIMEVKTGQIKALVNLTRDVPGVYEENLNYAISEKVEPGSTWKLFTLMSLFEDGYTSPTDSVDLNNGEIVYYNTPMTDSEGRHHMRKVPVQTAFAKSSNVGISRLANQYYKADPSKYTKHIVDAGLNKKTGIEIPGEPSPVFKLDPKAKDWSGITLPWMSVGYELEITPLQLLTFYNAIANDGVMMKPYIVEETHQYGKTVQQYKPVILNEKVCSSKTVAELKQCMLAVVDSGTAKHLHNDFYQFAGKTGTAQLIIDGMYTHNYLASFIGYFPADNPKYSCIVMVNSPSNGIFYGGYVAGPVFREISDKIYSHHIAMREPVNNADSLYVGMQASDRGYSYDFKEIFDWFGVKGKVNTENEWVSIAVQHDTLSTQTIKINQTSMPSVRGMGLRDALYLLGSYGLNVNVDGVGKVTSQSIEQGQFITKGMYVSIHLN